MIRQCWHSFNPQARLPVLLYVHTLGVLSTLYRRKYKGRGLQLGVVTCLWSLRCEMAELDYKSEQPRDLVRPP